MQVVKFFCPNIDCENREFRVYLVKKKYIILRCGFCKKNFRVHRTHIPKSKIKEYVDYIIEDENY